MILAQIVKYLFNEEVEKLFVHIEDVEEDSVDYINLVYGESEKLFFDNVCRVMEHLKIDLMRFKAWLIPDFEDEEE